jgi:AraC family transcriptional regulator of adaptative response/methylated-DNA-[protein]-cysteine methyltransferase
LKAGLRRAKDVTEALYDAGFGSSSRLYERSDAQLGMTPATYRRGGLGVRIAYTIEACPLGRLLVAATERGVAAVSLGDSDEPLEAALRAEYPNADVRRDAGGLSRWVGAILSHLDGERPDLDLPVDVVATAFQRRVWQALRRIPYGETRSYAEVARSLGQPRAARAVARACAANPTALVVPCQRVVASDGASGGYRWGAERKRALLAREAGHSRRE